MFRTFSHIAISASTAALLLAGCGGGAPQEARAIQKRSVVTKTKPLETVRIPGAELASKPHASVSHALLDYWSALQYQGFHDAVNYYISDLRAFVGDDQLLVALTNQAPYYRSTRPIDIAVQRNQDTVRTNFILLNSKGERTPSSVSWVRTQGAWRIVYDPYLDSALAQAAQLDKQLSVDPLAQKPSRAALDAGNAARHLQARFAATKQRAAKQAPLP